jgi:hypothetical protein
MRDAVIVAKKLGLTQKSRHQDRRPTLDELDRLLTHFLERSTRRPASDPIAVIPPKAHLTVQREYDTEAYKWLHMIEDYFAKIKEFRDIKTRYDQTESSYIAFWHLAAALIAYR